MRAAFLRLFLIAALVIFTFSFVVFLMNMIIPSVGPLALPPEWQAQGPWILTPGDQHVAPAYSLKAYRAALEYDEKIIPYLPLRASQDREWYVLPAGPLEEFATSMGPVERRTSTELDSLRLLDQGGRPSGEAPLRLKEFLRVVKAKRLAFEIHSRELAAVTFLVKDLKEFSLPNEILATSPNHLVLRELRKQKPLWWYSADPSTLAQWNVFAAVFLEKFAPQNFDWLRLDETMTSSPRASRELQRRAIPWVWCTNEFQNSPWPGRPWAILTNRPKSALNWPAAR